MAQPSNSPVSVIGSQFMAPHQIDIIVHTNSFGNLLFADTNHKIMLKVKPSDSSKHRVLLDVDDNPVVLIRKKIMTAHKRWNVFRGSKSDLIFATKKAQMIQFETSTIHVLLENKNSRKDVFDFKIKGSWSKRNFIIYMGDTSTTIAQMYKMDSTEFVKDRFMVRIYEGVDYAFVVTLIAILDAMNSSKD